MICQGDVISYLEMCDAEGVNALQRGMNYRLNDGFSIVLMSTRPGAPYRDTIENNGKVLLYEGHDVPKTNREVDPKTIDQRLETPTGTPTQNGLFFKSAQRYKSNQATPEPVKVYEKLRQGILVYNGLFHLIDAWRHNDGTRKVFKYKLQLIDEPNHKKPQTKNDLTFSRLIPPSVKLEVWKRDKGRCVICGSKENLHFDHIIPYSKGGSSLTASNIQLLCARHNIAKGNKII